MQFRPIPWDAPFDVAHELSSIPRTTQIKGVFVGPLVAAARAAGVPSASLRERYLPQQSYPLIEHATLLVDVARTRYPKLSLRRGLRKLGRAGIKAYLDSLVGRVTVGATDDPQLMLETLARAYPLNVSGADARLERVGNAEAVLELHAVPYFLDCHHVGVIEQSLKLCGVAPYIEVAPLADSAAYRCTWS